MAEGAYARAGVDQLLSGNAVAALVDVLAGIRTGRPSRAALASGHYANVLRLDESRGLALSCDSVGSKVIVCEQLGRYDTIGLDLFGMNANDVICVGADPIALLDYIAVEEANPEELEQIGIGLRRGAEQAGVEIPGGELAVLPEVVRGHPSPHGFDLVGFCVGLVDLDAAARRDGREDGRHRKRRVDAVAGVGLEAQQVEEAVAGDVGEPTHFDVRLEQLADRPDVDDRRLEEVIAHGRAGELLVQVGEHVACKAQPVRVDPARGDPDDRVTRLDVVARHNGVEVDEAHAEPHEVEAVR